MTNEPQVRDVEMDDYKTNIEFIYNIVHGRYPTVKELSDEIEHMDGLGEKSPEESLRAVLKLYPTTITDEYFKSYQNHLTEVSDDDEKMMITLMFINSYFIAGSLSKYNPKVRGELYLRPDCGENKLYDMGVLIELTHEGQPIAIRALAISFFQTPNESGGEGCATISAYGENIICPTLSICHVIEKEIMSGTIFHKANTVN